MNDILEKHKELWKIEIRENPNFNNLLDKLIEIQILVDDEKAHPEF